MHHRLGPSSKLNPLTLNAASRTKKYDGKIAGLYDLEETLGRGHFAVVKLARHVFTGEKVAVKVIDKTKLDEVSKAHLFQEVRCMKLVQHPNVVRLYEVIDTATKLYLVLELGDGGDLYEYIMRHESGLPERVAKEYFSQIVKAISYCHQLHVVHRDLKPENVVFFKKQGIVKLTDFGFSNKFYPGQKLETSCGSLAYSAPEILLGDSYDAPAVDVWSLGVILYMLVCGQPPFQEANDSETLTMIMDCKYEIPSHVSSNCRKLISRMLVRNPEKRATLSEIANHPWINTSKQDNSDLLPLISKEHLSEDDHNLIVQKIVNGNIATKEEVQESLEKNEYNHITATYFLLAERKLKCKRQEQLNKNRRPEELNVIPDGQSLKTDNSAAMKPNFLNVPRTPGELPQRSRKCSIVQEDEEDEDITPCSGREELGPPLNRRGSRSEGRLNFALQERLAESEKKPPETKYRPCAIKPNEPTKYQNTFNKHLSKMKKIPPAIITSELKSSHYDTLAPLGLSTISFSPISNVSSTTENIKLATENLTENTVINRPYEQRKTKFHKNRTASCSSSDASDEDSEKRKKRAQKLNTPTKTFEGRRDSHDDSSDSQEPSTGAGARGGNLQSTARLHVCSSKSGNTDAQDNKDKNSNDQNERKHGDMNFRRTHKNIRKRSGNTRLRESQSLNRITEVQEDTSQIIAPTIAPPNTPQLVQSKVKNVGTKILESFNKSSRKKGEEKFLKLNTNLRISRRDTLNTHRNFEINKTALDKTENCNKFEKCCIKKIRIFGKYFQVHKKLCIPITGIFCQNGLYKAQSCSSLTKGKPVTNTQELKTRCRGLSVIRCDGDINQNETVGVKQSLDINTVCNELTEICALHLQLGPATKCSFC